MKSGLVRSAMRWLMLALFLVILVVTAGAQIPASAPLAPDGVVLWDQPVSESGDAVHSHDYEPDLDAYDISAADDFSNTEPWVIDTIFVAADTWLLECHLTCADALNWEIYGDAEGLPDGGPWGGGNPPAWSLMLEPLDPRVTLDPGFYDWLTDVTLHLETPFELPAGTWWLVFYPSLNYVSCGCDAGWLVSDTANGYAAMVANPGEGWGFPPMWTSILDPPYEEPRQDLAFRLEGPRDYDLGGWMWFDRDWDGIQDPGELAVDGLGVNLYDTADCSGSLMDEAYAGTDGVYLFHDLPVGDYCIKMKAFPPGWFPTLDNAGGDDTRDSDMDPFLDKIPNIHLTGDDLEEDIGLVAVGTISGTVYCDQNLNSQYDAGEGLYVSIRLDMDDDCDQVGDLYAGDHTTGADGGYEFSGQAAGPSADPWCYVLTVNEEYLEDCDQGPIKKAVQLDTDEPEITVDFVFHELYDLGDLVWYDADWDGIQDSGEKGIKDFALDLYDNAWCSGSPITSTLTDASGTYTFTALSAGEYCIDFHLDVYDWDISLQDQGSDDAVDSDAEPGGLVSNIQLADDDMTQDIGLYPLGTIGGEVFCDADMDSFHDPGEERANVTLSLHDDDGCDASADAWREDVDTDSQGFFGFYQLRAGPAGSPKCYVVKVDVNDMGDCDLASAGVTERTVQFDENNLSGSARFVFHPEYEVSGRVWFDSDQDGLRDQGEPGVAGILARWYMGGDCTGQLQSIAPTGSDGTYSFESVAGTYCLEFGDIPPGWQISPRDQGSDDTVDSDVDASTARLQSITLSADLAHLDAGVNGQGSVGDRVWCDADGNDLYDAGEGVQNVVLNLYKDDTCDAWADDYLDGATTGADGYYLFQGMEVGPAGSPTCYVVSVEVADMGSCRDPITPTEYAVSLEANAPSYLGADFGFRNSLRVYLPLVVGKHK